MMMVIVMIFRAIRIIRAIQMKSETDAMVRPSVNTAANMT